MLYNSMISFTFSIIFRWGVRTQRKCLKQLNTSSRWISFSLRNNEASIPSCFSSPAQSQIVALMSINSIMAVEIRPQPIPGPLTISGTRIDGS